MIKLTSDQDIVISEICRWIHNLIPCGWYNDKILKMVEEIIEVGSYSPDRIQMLNQLYRTWDKFKSLESGELHNIWHDNQHNGVSYEIIDMFSQLNKVIPN